MTYRNQEYLNSFYEQKAREYIFNLITLGNSGVGKTSLICRYCMPDLQPLQENPSTLGIETQQATIDIRGKEISLLFYDTAGQEKFRVLTRSYYQKADGVVFVYDVTDRSSFNDVGYWIQECARYNNKLQKILVANKIDLPNPEVNTEEGQKLAEQHNIKFFSTSAVTADGIDQCIRQLAGQILQFKVGSTTSFVLSSQTIKSEPKLNKTCCVD